MRRALGQSRLAPCRAPSLTHSLSRSFYGAPLKFDHISRKHIVPPAFGLKKKSRLPPVASVRPFELHSASVRLLMKHPQILPNPIEPYPGNLASDLRLHTDTWSATRPNDGNGDRASNIMNFHWRVMNAMDLEAVTEFQQHVRRLDQGDHWVAAIFRAPNGYDFCPGADLVKLGKGDLEYNRKFYKVAHETVYAIATMKTPSFPIMQGYTAGVGAGLTMHSLYRVATESAVWSMPNVLYGSVPDMGSTFMLPRIEGEVGLYLALTGKRLESTDIVRVGLATHFMPLDNVKRFEQETGRLDETTDMTDLCITFHSLAYNIPPDSAIEAHLPAIERCFSKDTLKEVFEALEDEKTEWSQAILERLQMASPLMLHVTFRMQRLGRYLNSLEEALALEYRVLQHVIQSADFYEGIDARMSDREAIWQYRSIDEVPEEVVTKFFEPTGDELEFVASSRGVRPSDDPWRILQTEAEALITHPTYEYLTQSQLRSILPPHAQSAANLKAFYTKIFQEGGMAQEGGSFHYKQHVLEVLNPDPVTDKNFMKRKSIQKMEAEDRAARQKARAVFR